MLGGIAIRVPPKWRVEADVHAFAGGVAVDAPAPQDPEAPVLALGGRSVLGGVAVAARRRRG